MERRDTLVTPKHFSGLDRQIVKVNLPALVNNCW